MSAQKISNSIYLDCVLYKQNTCRVSCHYAKGALQFIVPVLLQKLTKQEEVDDEDDWNPSKAAGVCLMLLSTCCEDEIVPHVLPFIKGTTF